MSEVQLAVIIMVVSSLVPCLLIGYMIGIKQRRDWLAGFDESKVSDPEAYARFIAKSIVLMGVLISIAAIVWGTGFLSIIGLVVAILAASFLVVLLTVYANITFKN